MRRIIGATLLAAVGALLLPATTGAAAPLCYAPINGPAEQVVVHAGSAGSVNVRANPGVGGQLLCMVPNDTVLRVDPGSVSAPAPGLSGQWRHVWVIGPGPSYQPMQGWSVIESLDPKQSPSPAPVASSGPPNFSQFAPTVCAQSIQCGDVFPPGAVSRYWMDIVVNE